MIVDMTITPDLWRTRPTVAVFGLGYVGLPLAVRAVRAGYRVYGFDVNEDVVRKLEARVPTTPDVTPVDLDVALAAGLSVHSDPSEFVDVSVYVVCVPTDADRDGRVILDPILWAAWHISCTLAKSEMVILESTVPIGTTRNEFGRVLAELSWLTPGVDFHLGYAPERINPGDDTTDAPRVVGAPDASIAAVAGFYESLDYRTHRVNGWETAEAAKLVENTYRNVNVALQIEVEHVLTAAGVNPARARTAAATKPYGYQPFDPGIGIGGHCIPVDPLFLQNQARQTDTPTPLLDAAISHNQQRPHDIAARTVTELADRHIRPPARILITGIGYKPGSQDTRNSPAYTISNQLARHGYLIEWWDPHTLTGPGRHNQHPHLQPPDATIPLHPTQPQPDLPDHTPTIHPEQLPSTPCRPPH